MTNQPIINRIDKQILSFITTLLKPHEGGHDIEVFYQILNGERFNVGNVSLILKLGSSRRLDIKKFLRPIQSPTQFEPLFYNEFKVEINVTSETLSLSAILFHNEENKTEGFHYMFNNDESDLSDGTWVLPEGNYGRPLPKFFDDIYLLNKLNRELRVEGMLCPSLKNIEINNRLDELLESASSEQLNGFIANFLENDEKIRIIQYLSTEKKIQLLDNLNN